MPRCLTIQRTLVTPPDRVKFAERLERKRDYYTQAGCRYWVFEESGLRGSFLEFTEAPDAGLNGARRYVAQRNPTASGRGASGLAGSSPSGSSWL